MSDVTGVAIDLGGTKIAVARYIGGELIDHYQVKTESGAGAESQITTILTLLKKVQCNSSDRVGVAVSGRVDSEGCWHAINTNTLNGIEQVELKKIFEKRLKQPVNIVNDAVSAGLAEAVYGAGRDIPAFAYITVSTGVGGVCVLNGKPIVSDNGLAGHVGFMTITHSTELCGSGRIGTVENVASGRAIERQAQLLKGNDYTAKDIVEFHLAGNDWATQIVENSAAAIAELCGNLAAAIGISIVVVGGGVGLSKGYCKIIQAFIDTEPKLFRVRVERAQLEAQSVLIGALIG
ncbi:MAG: N-acylmannosamine kinase [Porticoccaceae bacterium]|jgi:N-acylmannosamine kinase